jgi:hypothetical protein
MLARCRRVCGESNLPPTCCRTSILHLARQYYDALDYYKLAAIALPNGAQPWLIRYRGNPMPGTVVYVDGGANTSRAAALVKQTLGLSDNDLIWTSLSVSAAGIWPSRNPITFRTTLVVRKSKAVLSSSLPGSRSRCIIVYERTVALTDAG